MIPGYRLVVAANRDEYFDRPTAPLDFLDAEKKTLAGLDVRGGGTWLGISSPLRFGAITNYRDPLSVKADAPTRGKILTDFLTGNMTVDRYLADLAVRASHYSGFNVVLGDDKDIYYYCNRFPGIQRLRPGFYGLSNHLLDSPWPKVSRGKELLKPLLVDSVRVDIMAVLGLLEDDWVPADDKLPDTGIGLEWERLLGSIFVNGKNYGTRSSAVITIDDDGRARFVEKTFLRPAPGSLQSQLTEHTLIC